MSTRTLSSTSDTRLEDEISEPPDLPPSMDTSQGLSASLLDLLYPIVTKTKETRAADLDISAWRPISLADLQRRIEGPQVSIFVGAEKTRFILPRSLSCDASIFFQRAFLGYFLETKSQSMNLPDADAESFLTIVVELLTGNFRVHTPANETMSDFAEYRFGLMPAIKVYILASQMLLENSQKCAYNEIVKAFSVYNDFSSPLYDFQSISLTVSPETLRLILDTTPEGDLLQKFMVDSLWSVLHRGTEHITVYHKLLQEHPPITLDFLKRSLGKISLIHLAIRRKREIAEAESKRQPVSHTPTK
ncbi:MAG: hypothetical protein Q9160_005909 [Pyrenula sp. 1 TL-2023]